MPEEYRRMLSASTRRILLGVAVACALSSTSFGAVIYGSTAVGELTGSRTSPTNVVIGGSMTTYTAAWTITNPSGGAGLSHLILNFSDSCINDINNTFADANCATNATVNGSAPNVALVPGLYGPASANIGFPTGTTINGVKFNITGGPGSPVTIAFDSNRAPVYGDFYSKVANSSFAYNNGLTNHASTLLSDFIARPDGDTPEPGTLSMLVGGLGLVGYAAFRRRYRSNG